ncbi:hypothetical protein [Lysobacter sp. TAB13]|uniref:hypothetical protein n=1 Tax=Lysobacter sp. TAB13 TaxID=3233065 RepID=UPI003F96D57E
MRLIRSVLSALLLPAVPLSALAGPAPGTDTAPAAAAGPAKLAPAKADRNDPARVEPDHSVSKGGDPRIRAQLEGLGYKYEVDKDGDFVLTFALDKQRSQMAYVLSGTQRYGKLEVREIWSPGYRGGDSQLPGDVANRLLEDSQLSKMGGWVKQDGVAVFVVKIDAGASQDDLDDAIDYVVRAADKMEAELTPDQDEF